MKLKQLREKVEKASGKLKDTCWKGYTAVGMKMKNGRKVPNCVPVKEAYGPLVTGASPRSTTSRQAPKPQEKPTEKPQQSQQPVKPASNLSSDMDRAKSLARAAMVKQMAKQRNEQFIVPTGFSEETCTCEREDKKSCKMHGEQWNVAMGENTEPSYRLRAARQHYAKVYMGNAKTIHQSKDAKEKAYSSVKAKYGDKIHDELKAYHEKNMKEEVEQIDENSVTHYVYFTHHTLAKGRGIGVNAKDENDAIKKAKIELKKNEPYYHKHMNVHDVETIKEEVEQNKNLSDAHAKAREVSKKEGVVQHVEKNPKTGHHTVSDFYDADKTVATYNNGKLKESAAWERKEGKNPEGGLNRKGIESYRRENPGSKLSLAVTTKPSKLKRGSKAWNRRKSFCARMSGMKKRLTSAETARDPDSRINKSLRKWNC